MERHPSHCTAGLGNSQPSQANAAELSLDSEDDQWLSHFVAEYNAHGERDTVEPSLLAILPQSTTQTSGRLALPSHCLRYDAGHNVVSTQAAGRLVLPAQPVPSEHGALTVPVQAAAAPAAPKRGRPRKAEADKKLPDFFFCRYCLVDGDKRQYQRTEGLQRHMAFEHNLLVPGKRQFPCDDHECGAVFNRAADKQKHQRMAGFHKAAWEKKAASAAFQVAAPVTQQELIDTFALVHVGPVSAYLCVPPELRDPGRGRARAGAAPGPSAPRRRVPRQHGARSEMLANIKAAVLAAPSGEQGVQAPTPAPTTVGMLDMRQNTDPITEGSDNTLEPATVSPAAVTGDLQPLQHQTDEWGNAMVNWDLPEPEPLFGMGLDQAFDYGLLPGSCFDPMFDFTC